MENVGKEFEAFGFRVLEADSDNMGSLLCALEEFTRCPQNSKPTAIICNSSKGLGGFAGLTNKHKASIDGAAMETEQQMLQRAREQLVHNLNRFDAKVITALAKGIGYDITCYNGTVTECIRLEPKVPMQKAAVRNKALQYDASALPSLDRSKEYGAGEITAKTMSVFAQDSRLYTIDADLSNASGLYDGTRVTNRGHAINAGIAECNMMCMAEALASEGGNVWVSTFAPFFDWQAFRRIAVSYQERMETIAQADGWLNEGHNLDITFIATAANLDTAVNGATHMANDDSCFFSQLAHVKLIDISCPQQLLSVLKWIAAGNKGLVYLRVMRNPSRVLYSPDFQFEYGKGYYLKNPADSRAVIVSSGHGILEALEAADLLEKEGIPVKVLDMPSFDSEILDELLQQGTPILFAEQNNGALFNQFSRHLLQHHISCDTGKIHQLSTLTADHQLQFIQSGTYSQLAHAFGLDAGNIADTIKANLK